MPYLSPPLSLGTVSCADDSSAAEALRVIREGAVGSSLPENPSCLSLEEFVEVAHALAGTAVDTAAALLDQPKVSGPCDFTCSDNIQGRCNRQEFFLMK